MYDFTLVTYSDLAGLDPDDGLLQEALLAAGMRVRAAVWSDETVDWAAGGITVVRSTWDYHLQLNRFIEWMNRVDKVTILLNPLPLMRWNCKKTYLQDLSLQGVHIVPTLFVNSASRSIHQIIEEQGWPQAVIKPEVGLSTFGVRMVSLCSAGQEKQEDERHFRHLLQQGVVLVQQYMSAIALSGERALCFIGGRYSHAVRKSPFQQLAVAGKAGEQPAQADPDELETAAAIIQTLPVVPAYARVDLVRDESGKPALMELELIEPSLFLSMGEGSAAAFAQELCNWRRRTSPAPPFSTAPTLHA